MEFDIIPPTDWDQPYHADSASDESSDSVVEDTYYPVGEDNPYEYRTSEGY